MRNGPHSGHRPERDADPLASHTRGCRLPGAADDLEARPGPRRRVHGHLAPVSLELGGKPANIVFGDADLDAAANGVIAGIFAATGQTCMAGSRLLVQRDVHDALVERVASRAREIKLG